MNHKRKNNKIPKIARVELKKLKLQLVFLLKHVRNASTKMINQFISNVRKFYYINGYLPSIDCTSFDTDPRFMISLGKRFDIEDVSKHV